jgi:hypothetical protein
MEKKISFTERFKSPGPMLAAFALAMIVGSPVMASPVTFAQYVQVDGSTQQWAITGSGSPGTTTVDVSGQVYFTFSASAVPGAPSGPQTATFTLIASSNSIGNCGVSCGPGDSLVQPGYTGTFSFIDESAGYVGDNLLSGTFAVTGIPGSTGAQFSSSVGGSGASFNASATAGNLLQLIFTSSFVNFTGALDEDSSFSLSSLIPNFAVGTVNIGPPCCQAYPDGAFNAAGAGTFSDEVITPEPATLILIGGGLLGLGMLRRKRLSRS